jgi:DNA-directed RNA polymerase specialized sigma54-like protein
MLKQFLNLKLSQKLSPQQIQLMKLIQLPTQAFEQRLLEEMNENPALKGKKRMNTKMTSLKTMIMTMMMPNRIVWKQTTSI